MNTTSKVIIIILSVVLIASVTLNLFQFDPRQNSKQEQLSPRQIKLVGDASELIASSQVYLSEIKYVMEDSIITVGPRAVRKVDVEYLQHFVDSPLIKARQLLSTLIETSAVQKGN